MTEEGRRKDTFSVEASGANLILSWDPWSAHTWTRQPPCECCAFKSPSHLEDEAVFFLSSKADSKSWVDDGDENTQFCWSFDFFTIFTIRKRRKQFEVFDRNIFSDMNKDAKGEGRLKRPECSTLPLLKLLKQKKEILVSHTKYIRLSESLIFCLPYFEKYFSLSPFYWDMKMLSNLPC